MLNYSNRATRGHAAVILWVIIGVALSLLPAPASGAYAQQSRTMNGIAVTGRFLEVWSRQGSDANSVYVNGLPITQRRSEISLEDGRTYETQWFERTRYELHPENSPPNDVLLGRLGAWDSEGRGKVDPVTGKAANPDGAPFVAVLRPQDADGTRKLWFPETGHTLSGKLLDYWWRYGGLAQFGYPLSEPFEEISRADGKPYTVQYFERARMELHAEKPAPYEVELGLLGVEQVGMRAVAADELPVAPPLGVRSSRESITIGSLYDPDDITILNNHLIAVRIRSLIEDSLVGRDENGNLFPLIAWYVPTIENGGARFVGTGRDLYLQVRYKLRQGIRWSDGKEVTSNDVVFAYKLIMHPNAPVVSREEYQRIQNVDNPDKYTAIFRYRSAWQAREYLQTKLDPEWYSFIWPFVEQNKPVVSPLYSEVGIVLPAHVLSDIPPARIKDHLPYARAPIGTGAWKVESWSNSVVRLVPNEHYNLTRPPALKGITIKFYANLRQLEDAAARGELDLIVGEGYRVAPTRTDLVQAGLRVVSQPDSIWEHLTLSFNYDPFKERAVREAMILAINRQQIVDVAYRGAGKIANSVVPSTNPYSLDHEHFAQNNPEVAARYRLPKYPYDPQKAIRLLEEAGWKLDSDGVRAKNGVKLKFLYGAISSENLPRQQIQTIVAGDLRAVGIEAEVKQYRFCAHCEPPQLIPFGSHAMIQFAWRGAIGTDFDPWTCAAFYDPKTRSGQNEQHYCNPALDKANTRFKTEIGQEAKMANAEAQVIMMQDIAIIPLVQWPKIEVVQASLQNYTLTSSTDFAYYGYIPWSPFWNARQWWFK
jgi:peptide/nickel transport system substrate-binding protein